MLEIVTTTAAEPFVRRDAAALDAVIQHLRTEQIVLSMQFFSPQGEVVAGNFDGDAIENDLLGKTLILIDSPMLHWSPDRLTGCQAIIFDRKPVGEVAIALSTAQLQQNLAVLRRQGIEVALLSTAIASLLAFFLSRTITKPLKTLVEAANRLAAGGLNQRIEIRTHDELAALGAAMEHMRAELQESYSNLELEVSDRTRALERRTRELSELNANKDKFFTILSHDLQTPISGLLDLIAFIPENLEHLNQAELRETLDTMRTALENFHELLKNLFTWSGIQRGTLTHHPQILDIHEIVRRNLSLLMPIAEKKHVRLKNLIPIGTRAYADPDMVYAIVRSLLSNALKFTAAGDNVRVSVEVQENHMLQVSVADTGVGIRQEDLAKLFRPDVTHQTCGTAGEEGTGVGLLLCKELVEQNGGTIWVESAIGKGTTFRFTLPFPPEL